MSDIENLIQHALDKDYNKASEVFGDLMGEKIATALDQQKAHIASQIYNGGAPEEDEIDDDIELTDEELEDIDLEDDDYEDDELEEEE